MADLTQLLKGLVDVSHTRPGHTTQTDGNVNIQAIISILYYNTLLYTPTICSSDRMVDYRLTFLSGC